MKNQNYIFNSDGSNETIEFSIHGEDFSGLSLSLKSNPEISLSAEGIPYPLDDLSKLTRAYGCKEARLEFFGTPSEKINILGRSKNYSIIFKTNPVNVEAEMVLQSIDRPYSYLGLKDNDSQIVKHFFESFQKTIYNLILEKINALDLKAPEVIEKITPEKLMERIIEADVDHDYTGPVFLISRRALAILLTQKYFEHAFLLNRKILDHKAIVIRSWTGEEVLFGDFRSVFNTVIFDDFKLIREIRELENLSRISSKFIFGVAMNPAYKNFVQRIN